MIILRSGFLSAPFFMYDLALFSATILHLIFAYFKPCHWPSADHAFSVHRRSGQRYRYHYHQRRLPQFLWQIMKTTNIIGRPVVPPRQRWRNGRFEAGYSDPQRRLATRNRQTPIVDFRAIYGNFDMAPVSESKLELKHVIRGGRETLSAAFCVNGVFLAKLPSDYSKNTRSFFMTFSENYIGTDCNEIVRHRTAVEDRSDCLSLEEVSGFQRLIAEKIGAALVFSQR